MHCPHLMRVLLNIVTPAEAGIQGFQSIYFSLDPGSGLS